MARSVRPAKSGVLVLDFGGQTAQLIARRIRDANVFCELVLHDFRPSGFASWRLAA